MPLSEMAPFLAIVTAKATVLLALALLSVHFLRKSNASTRHAVCAVSLAAVAILPALALSIPQFGINAPPFVLPGITATMSTAAASIHSRWHGGIETAFIIIWACGFAFFLLRFIAGWLIVQKFRNRSKAPRQDAEWSHAVRSAASEMRMPGDTISLRLGAVTAAVTCGIGKPAVLLPESAKEWTPAHRRIVLLHELAHIRRRDCLWNHIAQLACALFWFHPLIWVMQARMRREEELACDDAVLSAGVEPAEYAGILLESARSLHSSLLFACGMSGKGRPAELRHRFSHLLDSDRDHRAKASRASWLTHAFAALLLVISSVNSATAQVYKIGGDVSAPKLIAKTEPTYTAGAKNAKIQGTVLLSVVIGKNGRATKVTVQRTLDKGLDAKATEAVKQWRFEPALRKNKPVAVQARIEVNFRLL